MGFGPARFVVIDDRSWLGRLRQLLNREDDPGRLSKAPGRPPASQRAARQTVVVGRCRRRPRCAAVEHCRGEPKAGGNGRRPDPACPVPRRRQRPDVGGRQRNIPGEMLGCASRTAGGGTGTMQLGGTAGVVRTGDPARRGRYTSLLLAREEHRLLSHLDDDPDEAARRRYAAAVRLYLSQLESAVYDRTDELLGLRTIAPLQVSVRSPLGAESRP